MKRKVLAIFRLSKYNVSLTVHYFDINDRAIYIDSVNVDNLFGLKNVNNYADIISDMLRKANNEMSTMISEVYTFYTERNLHINHDKIRVDDSVFANYEISDFIQEKLSKVKNTDKMEIVKFLIYKYYREEQNYTVLGNSYIDSSSRLNSVREIFDIAGINIRKLIPLSLSKGFLLDDNMNKKSVNIDISFDRITLSIYKGNTLWEKINIDKSIKEYIHELSSTFKYSFEQILEKIISYLNFSNDSSNVNIFEIKYNEVGSIICPELSSQDVRKKLSTSINDSIGKIVDILIEKNATHENITVTGDIFSISNIRDFISSLLNFENINIYDIYHDRKCREDFNISLEKYVKANYDSFEYETNMISTIKEKAITATSNHKKVKSIRSIITKLSKNDWIK